MQAASSIWAVAAGAAVCGTGLPSSRSLPAASLQELMIQRRPPIINEHMLALGVPEQRLPHVMLQQRQASVGLVLDSGAGRGPSPPAAADHHALSVRAGASPPAATGLLRLQQQNLCTGACQRQRISGLLQQGAHAFRHRHRLTLLETVRP